ncbi:MAG: hypothetical protein ACOZF0_06435 [Thermodesulfobacteriota bacterium]
MNFKKHLEIAWHQLFDHIASLIILTSVLLAVSIFSFGILAPVVTAGYMHTILVMLREDRKPSVSDLFSQMKLFFPLLGFSILLLIVTMIGMALFIIPGIVILFLFTFVFIYLIPLMTDLEMNLFDAMKKSYAMAVKENPSEHFIVVILYLCILSIGSSVFIGTIVTTPFAVIFLLSVYIEKMRAIFPPEKQR